MGTEPSPRWGHFSAVVEGRLCVWGGNPESKVTSTVHCFDPLLESWAEESSRGILPHGRCHGAFASAGHHLYVYGGLRGAKNIGSLHQLDTRSWTWKQLSSAGPMNKVGCRMIVYDGKLVLFGGFGSGPTQAGADYSQNKGDRWTNELHTYNLKEGM